MPASHTLMYKGVVFPSSFPRENEVTLFAQQDFSVTGIHCSLPLVASCQGEPEKPVCPHSVSVCFISSLNTVGHKLQTLIEQFTTIRACF